eukprot:TRINITY_DN14528_c0_g1_i1.p1 TRINITY_DN14528_c0_g1~~TRINITY_DN14528_c0_g1_i1.p1  ORF type:complete len:122 (+),score=42.88 TRINITY_DN14528_c0_g1_i1:27-368(+)
MSAPARPLKEAPANKPGSILRMLRHPENQANLKAVFAEFDTDNNGTLEREELINLLVKIYATPEFGGVDISADAENLVEALTKAYDTNNDGVLDWNEFLIAINILTAGEEETD